MIQYAMVLALATATPGPSPPDKQTVWWHTDGGSVVSFDDRHECTLFLFDTERGVIFSWEHSGEKLIFEDDALQYQNLQPVPATVQVGDTVLGPIAASGTNNTLSVPLPTIDSALPTADHVTVQVPDKEVRFDINRSKMPALLDALGKCRKAMRL